MRSRACVPITVAAIRGAGASGTGRGGLGGRAAFGRRGTRARFIGGGKTRAVGRKVRRAATADETANGVT